MTGPPYYIVTLYKRLYCLQKIFTQKCKADLTLAAAGNNIKM